MSPPQISHEGPCREEESRPLCPTSPCPTELSPVCGDDGVTYGSECELNMRTCSDRRGSLIRTRHKGPCVEFVEEAEEEEKAVVLVESSKANSNKQASDEQVKTEAEQLDHLYGEKDKESDGVKTGFKLEGGKDSGQDAGEGQGSDINGEAEDIENTTTTSEEEKEDCFIICPALYSPVCGTDGRTYSNACNLESKACRGGDRHLAIRHRGRCEDEDIHGRPLRPPPPILIRQQQGQKQNAGEGDNK